MKKALLILLMLLLPWQTIAAAERNFAHLMGSGSAQSVEFVAKHVAEHANHVPHHHHDDADDDDDNAGASLQHDDSAKSMRHLVDFDQSCTCHILIPAALHLPLIVASGNPPLFLLNTFSDRTIIPLLRPPRKLA